jgi:predicted nuclease of predicted toxin-antitoxin system
MKLRDFRVLTDENLDPVVVEWLCDAGFDVLDVARDGMQGASDLELLRRSASEQRVIVTHDADFGRLAILQGEPVVGILFVRPGHFDPQYTIDTLTSLFSVDPDLSPPFLLVARRRAGRLDIRIRGLP